MDLFRCPPTFIRNLIDGATGPTRMSLCRLYAGRLADDADMITSATEALFSDLVLEQGMGL